MTNSNCAGSFDSSVVATADPSCSMDSVSKVRAKLLAAWELANVTLLSTSTLPAEARVCTISTATEARLARRVRMSRILSAEKSSSYPAATKRRLNTDSGRELSPALGGDGGGAAEGGGEGPRVQIVKSKLLRKPVVPAYSGPMSFLKTTARPRLLFVARLMVTAPTACSESRAPEASEGCTLKSAHPVRASTAATWLQSASTSVGSRSGGGTMRSQPTRSACSSVRSKLGSGVLPLTNLAANPGLWTGWCGSRWENLRCRQLRVCCGRGARHTCVAKWRQCSAANR